MFETYALTLSSSLSSYRQSGRGQPLCVRNIVHVAGLTQEHHSLYLPYDETIVTKAKPTTDPCTDPKAYLVPEVQDNHVPRPDWISQKSQAWTLAWTA